MSGLRLAAIKNYKLIKKKQEYLISKEKLKEVPDDEKGLSENIEFIETCEQKFFKLLQVLVKNHDDNKKKLKKLKDPIVEHELLIGADFAVLDQKVKDGTANSYDKQSIKHILEVRDRIKNLAKIYDN